MKIFKPLLLSFIFTLFFSSLGYAQDHIITLSVNTGEIVKPDVNDYCTFGQTDETSNEDFTIMVNNGDTIQWIGVSETSEDDFVEISSINYHGGKNILGPNVINGIDGVVNATVTNAQQGDEEKYIVKFKVYNNGEKRNGSFQIDPKLKVRGGE